MKRKILLMFGFAFLLMVCLVGLAQATEGILDADGSIATNSTTASMDTRTYEEVHKIGIEIVWDEWKECFTCGEQYRNKAYDGWISDHEFQVVFHDEKHKSPGLLEDCKDEYDYNLSTHLPLNDISCCKYTERWFVYGTLAGDPYRGYFSCYPHTFLLSENGSMICNYCAYVQGSYEFNRYAPPFDASEADHFFLITEDGESEVASISDIPRQNTTSQTASHLSITSVTTSNNNPSTNEEIFIEAKFTGGQSPFVAEMTLKGSDGKAVSNVSMGPADTDGFGWTTSIGVEGTYQVIVVITDALGNRVEDAKTVIHVLPKVQAISTLRGDINQDGKITATDLVQLRNIQLGKLEPLDLSIADLDGDGAITSVDVELLQKYLIGEIDAFPADAQTNQNSPQPATSSLLGDINQDGKISLTDLMQLRDALAGKREMPDLSVADLDGDGAITSADVELLQKRLIGESDNSATDSGQQENTSHPATASLLGDINQDGKISTTDLVQLKEAIAGKRDMPDLSIADLDGDGVITSGDVECLQKLLVGKTDDASADSEKQKNPSQSTASSLRGDISGDGKITNTDLLQFRIAIGGTRAMPGLAIGDLDKDGEITSADVDVLQKYLIGAISHFPEEKVEPIKITELTAEGLSQITITAGEGIFLEAKFTGGFGPYKATISLLDGNKKPIDSESFGPIETDGFGWGINIKSEGAYRVKAVVTDALDNSKENTGATINVVAKTEPLSITRVTASTNTINENETVSIETKVAGGHAPFIGEMRLVDSNGNKIKETKIGPTETDGFGWDISIEKAGEYHIVVVITDAQGNRAEATATSIQVNAAAAAEPQRSDIQSSFIQAATSQYEEYIGQQWKNYNGVPYGSGVAWCSNFVSWCARDASVPETVIPTNDNCVVMLKFFDNQDRWYCTNDYNGGRWTNSRYYNPSIEKAEQAYARGHSSSFQPQAGDLILFETDKSLANGPDHIGIVTSVEGSTVYAVEGNYGNREISRIASTLYAWKGDSKVWGFCRPEF